MRASRLPRQLATRGATATLARMSVVAALLVASSATVSKDLKEANFERVVFGASAAFIKFYAPWCSHCQKLAPDWEKLEAEHATSSVLIGTVDCTDGPGAIDAGGGRNPLCDDYQVTGLPKLMYFQSPSSKGFQYEGHKSAPDLLAFAAELGSSCSPSARETCTESQLAMFDEYSALSVAELAEKASHILDKGENAKFLVAMLEMQMHEIYNGASADRTRDLCAAAASVLCSWQLKVARSAHRGAEKSMTEAARNEKVKELKSHMKGANHQMDEFWAQTGALRAMRAVLHEKEGGDKAIEEMDGHEDIMTKYGLGGAKRKAAKKLKDEL